jgi:hypothetical protein
MNQKKKVPNYRKQKAAFDAVLSAYRRTRAHTTGLGCVPLAPSKGSSVPDLAKPIPAEFRADVERVVEQLVAVKYHQWFWAAYSWYDSPDEIEREMFAQRLIGDRRHSWEQRLGAKFIEMGLFPPLGYFTHKRTS